ncbi:MAG: hypothetical protein N2489_01215 [Clostridia bacterium]|nr:hypothetical protein [Clostridia bacterium]
MSYNGELHTLQEAVLHLDGEYFIPAGQLSSILGLKCQISSSMLEIESEGSKQKYDIKSYDYKKGMPGTSHSTPELINGNLYFPFNFLKSEFNLIIKYNNDKRLIYIFPKSTSSLNTFANITYDYSVDLSGSFKLDVGQSENSFEDNSFSFSSRDNSIAATVSCDRLDEVSLISMRRYLNDFRSDDLAIFDEFVQYKKSYFNAMQDYYKRDFLYGIDDENSSESNMKIFSEYTEKLFGVDAYAVLYNITRSQKYTSEEEIHLSIEVPVSSNMTVYTVNFAMKKGTLKSSIESINDFLKSLSIGKQPRHNTPLKLFSDAAAIAQADNGIYPQPANPWQVSYSTLANTEAGFELCYPSHYVPYRNNSLIKSFEYRSFKINYNHTLSISTEPAHNNGSSIQEKIKLIQALNKDWIKSSQEGNISFGGNDFRFLKYDLINNQGNFYIQDYFIVRNSVLFNIQLQSRFARPSGELEYELASILSTLKFFEPFPEAQASNLPISKYVNKEEGYSLIYPASWKKTEQNNGDIYYDTFYIKKPDYSGPLEVLVSEGELASSLSPSDILKFVTGLNAPDLKKYFKKYNAPYMNKISRPLCSSIKVKDNVLYLYKLVNFLDESNRGKLCYSVDMVRDGKIYSLFITASDYMTSDGKVFDKSLSDDLNLIASTFGLEITPEYAARKSKGEKRNRKVVLIEDYIKSNVDKGSKVASISSLSSQNDLLVHTESLSGSFFYRITADFEKNKFKAVESIKLKDVMDIAAEKIRKQFQDKAIEEIKTDSGNMTVQIKYRENILFPILSKTYSVVPGLMNGSLEWNTVRKDYSNALKNDCKEFLDNLLSVNVKVYFDPKEDFSDISRYKEKGGIYYTPVFAEFGGLSGYFVLGINALNDSISLDSYTPIERFHDSINKMYSLPSADYSLYNIGLNEQDKFEFNVFMISKHSISYRLSKVKVSLNRATNKLEIK